MKRTSIQDLLQQTVHRPWPLPAGSWHFYQEWQQVLFGHWKVSPDLLRSLIPQHVSLDIVDGHAWVSIVAFTMRNTRPKMLPPFSPISDFHEINMRTYVTRNGKAGVYFLSMEGSKRASATLSKMLSGLPYQYADMSVKHTAQNGDYYSINKRNGFTLKASCETGEILNQKTPLDYWLTERYCLYDDRRGFQKFEVHHAEWPLLTVSKSDWLDYRFGNMILNTTPDIVHYSPGVQVLAWKDDQ